MKWPFIKQKFKCPAVLLLEKSFQMMYNNLGLTFRWTLPLKIVCLRTVIGVGNDVRGQYYSAMTFNGQLLSAAISFNTFLPLQITATVRGRTCRGLYLYADVPATDFFCRHAYLPRTITFPGHNCSGLHTYCIAAMCRREA